MEQEALKKRIDAIYHQYLEVISPFIVALEVADDHFPSEILNEIRAVTTHMARYQLAEDEEAKEKNIELAERHIKRATLDCYKYMCLSLNLQHDDLRNDYRSADLHLIDNGTFLSKLTQAEQEAKQLQLTAKTAEIDGNTPMDRLYELYEQAYWGTLERNDLLKDSVGKLEFAQSVADKNKRSAKWGLIVGVAGAVIGVAGIVIGILV